MKYSSKGRPIKKSKCLDFSEDSNSLPKRKLKTKKFINKQKKHISFKSNFAIEKRQASLHRSEFPKKEQEKDEVAFRIPSQ